MAKKYPSYDLPITEPIQTRALAAEAELITFLRDRKLQNLSPRTIQFYQEKLYRFRDWCIENVPEFQSFEQITPYEVRAFLEYLKNNGNNSGGVLTYYRSIKAFINFIEIEFEPDDWENPFKKVKTPKNPETPIEGIGVENIQQLIDACGSSVTGIRDQLIIRLLAETGVRASELLTINVEDIDLLDSSILIRQGKGRKPRSVFFGQSTRKVLRKHLKFVSEKGALLFSTRKTRLKQSGLRQVIRRLCIKCDLPEYSAHDFRRTYALESLNKGVDIITLSRLMGHTSLTVLTRYLRQTKSDLADSYVSILD